MFQKFQIVSMFGPVWTSFTSRLAMPLLETDLMPVELKKSFETAHAAAEQYGQVKEHFDDLELTASLGGGTAARRAADMARTKLDLQKRQDKITIHSPRAWARGGRSGTGA